jgi:hypothetical protein
LLTASYSRLGSDGAVIRDRVKGAAHEIRSTPVALDALERALLRCDGLTPMADLVAGSVDDPGVRGEVEAGLTQLFELGVLRDAHDCADYGLWLLTRLRAPDPDRVSEAYARSRWTDPRAAPPADSFPTRTPARRERPASVTADDLATWRQSSMPLTPSTAELAELVRAAYGWSGGHRVVASAGAMWPLVFHVLEPSGNGADLRLSWFDDALECLRPVDGVFVHKGELTSTLSPNPLVDLGLAGGVAIVAISADLNRIGHKYGTRAAHFALIEAGSVIQRVYEYAGSAPLAVRAMGGFNTRAVSTLLGAAGTTPLLLLIVAARPSGVGDA